MREEEEGPMPRQKGMANERERGGRWIRRPLECLRWGGAEAVAAEDRRERERRHCVEEPWSCGEAGEGGEEGGVEREGERERQPEAEGKRKGEKRRKERKKGKKKRKG